MTDRKLHENTRIKQNLYIEFEKDGPLEKHSQQHKGLLEAIEKVIDIEPMFGLAKVVFFLNSIETMNL